MISVFVLALAVTLQGDAGVLPANPVPPLVVASSGAAAVSGRLGGLFLNPANATGERGMEVGFVSFPSTGLQGFSVVGVGGGKLRLSVGLWSYALADVFDPELIAQDPSLRELGVSMAAASFGAAYRLRRFSVGASLAARTQNIVGTHTAAGSLSLGSRVELGALHIGASVVNVPWANSNSAAAPTSAVWLASAAKHRIGSATVRLELNGQVPLADRSAAEVGLSPSMQWGPLEIVWGYSSRTGWSGGASLRHERLQIGAATNFVGQDRLDHRVALSVSYH